MTSFVTNSLPGKRRILWLLLALSLTTVCLGSAIALVVFADTHSATESENQLRRTQEALLTLTDVSQQLDRVDLHARLYRLTAEQDHLRAAEEAAAALDTLLQRLTKIDWTPLQQRRINDLRAAAANLTEGVGRLRPNGASVRDEVVNCQRILDLMQEDERALLALNGEDAQRNSLFRLARRIGTIGVGSTLVLILFWVLMREAMHRGKFEERLAEANGQLRTTVQRLEEQAWQSRLLIAARDEVALCLEVQQAEECTVRFLGQLLPGTAGRLCILNHSRHLLDSVGSWGESQRVVLDGFEPECCCGLRSGRARWRRPEQSKVHCRHFLGEPPERYLCLPLIAHGETLGIVIIECPSAQLTAMTESRESALASLGEMAAMAVAGLRLRQKLENQSIRDGMTGLFNRSFMEIALERELHRAARQGNAIAIMMLDIDEFKQFNDTFGHEAGDLVLRSVADCMRAAVRGEDIVCRFGGEEFLVILPEIAVEAAMERAELLRKTVGDMALRFHGQPLRQVTISIGVAMYPQNSTLAEELLRSADQALYAAKHQGRNRVILAASSIAI